jgi:hypothetical protein
MTINDAIKAVAVECPNECAKVYAENTMRASLQYGIDGLKTQILYILENMKYWRGARAFEVRTILKEYVK